MQDIQEVFARLEKTKKSVKDIRKMYKDSLENTPGYADLLEQQKTLKEKIKQVQTVAKESMGTEFTKLEDLKIDVASDQEMLSDIALSKVMKGEAVAVTDEHANEYEPVFTVKFKKI